MLRRCTYILLGLIVSCSAYSEDTTIADKTPTQKLRTIAEAGNPADKAYPRSGWGSVDYIYRIAKQPVTNREYCAFLNAVEREADAGRYCADMQIQRTGEPGSYKYAPLPDAAERPVTSVSYMNAAEYCNWKSGGQVYRIVDEQVTRRRISGVESGEVFFIPTFNELYKAKYYLGGGKYEYIPSQVAEMVETRFRAWHRIAFGHGKKPDDVLYCNNFTSNSVGKSEDNIRNPQVGFRIASMPPIHLNPEINDQHNVLRIGTRDVAVSIRSTKIARAEFTCRMIDYWGKTVWQSAGSLNLQAGLNSLQLADHEFTPGYYRLVGTIGDDKQIFQSFSIPFTVTTKNPYPPQESSPFGVSMHMDRMLNLWGRVSSDEYEDLVLDAGISWVRTDLPFEYVTGAFCKKGLSILSFFPYFNNYSKFDSPFESAERQSKWSSLNIPPELYGYADECETLVKENPHVKHWEVGNEPHGWRISPGDYAQLVKTAYKVAKATDPDSFVIVGDMEHIHKSVLSVYHADNYADAVAIHTYGFLKDKEDYYEGVVSRDRELRRCLTENGNAEMPVWATELSGCGYWNHIFPGETKEERYRYQALDLPKKLAGSIGLGVSKTFYYELADTQVSGTEGEFGLLTDNLIPKPAYVSYKVTAEQLHGKTFSGWIDLGTDQLTGLAFKGESGNCCLLWREDKPLTLERRKRVDVPMVEISAPEFVSVKASGPVNLTSIMGETQSLEVVDGVVKIPVSEYPVFVNGIFELTYKDVLNLGKIKENKITEKNHIVVQILPPVEQVKGYNDLHNMQLQTRMNLIRQQDETFTIRLFNLSGNDIAGRVYLIPPQSNSDLGWIIKNTYDEVTVKAESTKTVSFTVNIPRRPYIGESEYVLKAVFESGEYEYTGDALVKQMINRQSE